MPSTRSSQSNAIVHHSKCRICGKSCQNISSMRRHERYCRSRLTNPAPPRRKSCLACIRAKSRCDSGIPMCGQCQQRGKDCMYSTEYLSSKKGQSFIFQPHAGTQNQSPDSAGTSTVSRKALRNSVASADNFISPEASSFELAPNNPRNSSPDSGNFDSAQDAALSRFAMIPSDALFPSTEQGLIRRFSSHILRPRERRPASLELVCKLLAQTLCSFSERRIDEGHYPPFIHHSAGSNRPDPTLEDPIIICQAITQQLAEQKHRGDLTVWNLIAAEQERIYDHRDSFDKWLHLSSAQATTVYLLMLAAEGESVLEHHPHLPITLLYTLGSLFGKLNQIHLGFTASNEQGRDIPTWQDWIFAESKLRMAAIYFIFALHFDVNFGIPCDRDTDYAFEDVNLPAAKVLWEAKDEASWTREFNRIQKGEEYIGPISSNKSPLNYGDLLKSNKQEYDYSQHDSQKKDSTLVDRVHEWQKGMDELGMLVALCSTME